MVFINQGRFWYPSLRLRFDYWLFLYHRLRDVIKSLFRVTNYIVLLIGRFYLSFWLFCGYAFLSLHVMDVCNFISLVILKRGVELWVISQCEKMKCFSKGLHLFGMNSFSLLHMRLFTINWLTFENFELLCTFWANYYLHGCVFWCIHLRSSYY